MTRITKNYTEAEMKLARVYLSSLADMLMFGLLNGKATTSESLSAHVREAAAEAGVDYPRGVAIWGDMLTMFE